MKDWVPLFQELVWPLFLVVAVFLARGRIARLLKALEEPVLAGG